MCWRRSERCSCCSVLRSCSTLTSCAWRTRNGSTAWQRAKARSDSAAASICLDIGLADDAAIAGMLPAKLGRKLRAAGPGWVQALIDQLRLDRGNLHGSYEPARELRHDGLWRLRRSEHAEPDLVFELLVTRLGGCWHVRQCLDSRGRSGGQRAQRTRLQVANDIGVVGD